MERGRTVCQIAFNQSDFNAGTFPAFPHLILTLYFPLISLEFTTLNTCHSPLWDLSHKFHLHFSHFTYTQGLCLLDFSLNIIYL